MTTHNSKVTTAVGFIVILIFAVNFVNTDAGTPVVMKKGMTIADVLQINQNAKSSNIQNLIFKPTTNTIANNPIKNPDTLNTYLINIFCSETTSKYVKVASGSGVFLTDPDDTDGVILTNAHVARHLLDANKKCVGRTGSPTTTTHTLTLRYIPSHWLDKNNQYVIGDPDQSSTGEFDFAIIESKRIKPVKKDASNIYTVLKQNPKLKLSGYGDYSAFNSTYIYSYPAREILTKNVFSPLYEKTDTVQVSTVYTSPAENITDSLLDVTGSKNVDHGSSGGMVISQGSSNALIGLSSVLIKETAPQVVRVVTLKHVFGTMENDLKSINNAQTDSFLKLIQDTLSKKEVDMSFSQILKNIKLTSVLEKYTRDTLVRLNIIIK